jgi:hypothetical protein
VVRGFKRGITKIISGTAVAGVDHFSVWTYSSNIMFTYIVMGDEFTLTETSNTGKFTDGPVGPLTGANGSFTITGAPTVNGTISQNNPPILQTATGTPAQEFWNYGPTVQSAPFVVICVRTRTFTKVND